MVLETANIKMAAPTVTTKYQAANCEMIIKPHVMRALLFDAHNHIHMSVPGGIPPLPTDSMGRETSPQHLTNTLHHTLHSLNENEESENHAKSISEHIAQVYESDMHRIIINQPVSYPIQGMALMSTQPRDFPLVSHLTKSLAYRTSWDMIPCFGIHPWFLHMANADFTLGYCPDPIDKTLQPVINNVEELILAHQQRLIDLQQKFGWYDYLVQQLQLHPLSHVGEIGLDGARFTYVPSNSSDESSRDKILVSPMDLQVEAMEIQFHLAADLHKSVSIHVVQAWGPVMELFQRVKKTRLATVFGSSTDKPRRSRKERLQERKVKKEQEISVNTSKTAKYLWPPKIYFHSFGGKPAVIDQLDALLGRSTTTEDGECIPGAELYFGFAPVINFRSPKTSEVVKKVGIHRLVLETDLEDYSDMVVDLHRAVEFVAEALNIEPDSVVEQTLKNAKQLYCIT